MIFKAQIPIEYSSNLPGIEPNLFQFVGLMSRIKILRKFAQECRSFYLQRIFCHWPISCSMFPFFLLLAAGNRTTYLSK
ncbi:hypothetical protein B0E43_20595 [Algoriphagus sp. A40]|nr:hypothetical protein B0E43_20595 [Algoriphagus sp. A40]